MPELIPFSTLIRMKFVCISMTKVIHGGKPKISAHPQY